MHPIKEAMVEELLDVLPTLINRLRDTHPALEFNYDAEWDSESVNIVGWDNSGDGKLRTMVLRIGEDDE